LAPELHGPQIAASEDYVYVLRGDVRYEFCAVALKLVVKTRLSDEDHRGAEGEPR
jgi:hypothetical protein